MNAPIHDRDCAHLADRYAYCDCALSTGRCRTLADLAAATPYLRARVARWKAIADRVEDEYEHATDPAISRVLHAVLTGEAT